jgi:translation initiation factor 4G
MNQDFECIDLLSNNLRFYKQINLPDEDRWILGSKIVKLDHYANGYIVPTKRNVSTENELQKLRKEIKVSLNKMTPENFDSCLKEMKKVSIGNDDAIECLIDEIFTKATLEPSYSSIYARFCSSFANIKVRQTTFKIALLRKCKNMFMKPLETQMDEVKSSWLAKIEKESDERMKNMYAADVEEQVCKAKDKYFGNLRFLAELYLQNTLSGKVVITCVNDLLNQNANQDAIDGACMMLPVCGKSLESNFPIEMQQLLADMTKLSKSENLERKKKFKLMDVIEMRNRKWEMREIQKLKSVAPKTLEEIRNEDKPTAVSKSRFASKY